VRRLIACSLLAVLAAVLGPRIVGPQNRSAGAPFAYEPPDGFVPAKDVKSADVEGASVWMLEGAERKSFDGSLADLRAFSTRIILNHSNKEMSVEETDLAKLVAEMPKAFEGACSWSHRRHELRSRSDGARVGLIEGDCNREDELSGLGLPSQPVKMRKLQLMFPDDTGTSIVTASYPADEAARWAPLLEATIGKARGVATRAPTPAPWTHAAWAAAGAVLGWFATALVALKGSSPEVPAVARERRMAHERSTTRERKREREERADAGEDEEEEEGS
jgi:hypothetical protein